MAERGWALGRDIYRTVDGGATWSFVHAVTWDGQFSFVDDQHGWAVARNEQEIALVRTAERRDQLVDPEARHGTVVRQQAARMNRAEGPWIRDAHGRRLILRGVNLGGSSKVPLVPDGATYRRDGLLSHREASFIGRPFPLEEADEHFRRLKRWGLTFLRLLTTWEAIEHAGPGHYDHDYLEYLVAIVRKAGEHGLSLFIDPHQDVWSRFSGGDGAPGWTLEAVGFELQNLHASGAAFLHQENGDPLPRMIWPTNSNRLAAATMFTLFFGGNDFAPRTLVDGEPVQEFLQRHYLDAVAQVALRLRGLSHVLGYDTLNEPSAGYIGVRDLAAVPGPLRLGTAPSPFEFDAAGGGRHTRPRYVGDSVAGRSAHWTPAC